MNTLVITGLVRNIPEFYSALNRALELREFGYIDQIVLSTWHGEINSEVGKALSKANIGTIESCPPPHGITPKPFWNTSAQNISLLRALEQLEESDCVLKVRTDKSTPLINRYIPFLKRGLANTESTGFFRIPPLKKKLIVHLIRASVPFHINDFTVMGLCYDLKNVCRSQFGLEHRAPANAFGAENRWLLGPFFDHSIRLRSFFESFRGFDLMAALNIWASEKIEPLPQTLHNLFSLYFTYLYSCFENLDEPNNHEERKPPCEIRSYFNIEDYEFAQSIGTAKGVVRNIRSINSIREFVRSEEPSDPNLNDHPLNDDEFSQITQFIQRYNSKASPLQNEHPKKRFFSETEPFHKSLRIDVTREIIDSLIACGLDKQCLQKVESILERKVVEEAPVKVFGLVADALMSDNETSCYKIIELLTQGAKLREPFAQELLVKYCSENKTAGVDFHIIDLARKDIERRGAANKLEP